MPRMEGKPEHSSGRAIAVSLLGAVMVGLGSLLFIFADRGATAFSAWLWSSAPWAVFLLMPLGLMVILWLRDHVFPWTDGTGIPQTIAVLEKGPGELRERLLSVRVAVGKALLTALGLFSLFSIGREGPTVQLGACFMHLVGKWARFPVHLAERGLIMAGGAAGIAAAFNAPIAGMVFAFEEIGRGFDKRNLGIIVRTVMLACLVCMAFLGNYFSLGRLDFGRAVPLEFLAPGPWVALLLIGAAGVETTQISNRHMKALDAIARHAFARSERVAAVIGCGEWEQARLEQQQNSQDIMHIHSYTSIY